MWSLSERAEFMQTAGSYWPTMKENEAERTALMKLYIERLQRWRFPAVLKVLGDVKAEGSKFIPELPVLVRACERVGGDSRRAPLLARLREIAKDQSRVGYYTTKQGKRMEIGQNGPVERRHPKGTQFGMSLLWSQLATEHLEEILRDNERHIEWQRPISLGDFCKSGEFQLCFERVIARGGQKAEETLAWLEDGRKRKLAGKDGHLGGFLE